MKLKKNLSVLIAVIMLFSVSSSAFAEDVVTVTKGGSIGKNITWEYDETEQVLTIGGEGPLENIYIGIIDGTAGFTPSEFRAAVRRAKKLVIGDRITSIGADALSGLASLENLVIPGNVKSIGNDAFENCINLRSLTIENGVESVGDRAFAGAYTLKNVYIPETVTEIGENAFTLFVPDAKYTNESSVAAIVPESDIYDSYTFTNYEYAELYAYYLLLDGNMKLSGEYNEKEILSDIYLKFGVSYMNLEDLKSDFYNNIAIDSVVADGVVIECFADSVQHKVCLDTGIDHEVADSDYDCLCGNHNIYENTYIAPTCTESGYAGGIICLECEEVMESPDVIPPTGHTDEDGDHICEVCGNEIERTVIEKVAEFFKGIVNSILAIFKKLFGR